MIICKMRNVFRCFLNQTPLVLHSRQRPVQILILLHGFQRTEKCSTRCYPGLEDVFQEVPEFDSLETDLHLTKRLEAARKLPTLPAPSPVSIPRQLCGVPLLEELFRRNQQSSTNPEISLLRLLTHDSVLYRAFLQKKEKINRLGRYLSHSRRLEPTRVNHAWITELGKLLRSVSFSFAPEQTIPIDLETGKSVHLAIPSPRDEVILEGLRLVLDAVYEPRFSPFSFGFRSGFGRQKALREIRNHFRGMDYYVVGDLTSCLQQFRGFQIIAKACEQVQDPAFQKLLYKALDIGYFNIYGIQEESFVSINRDQGISPVLVNIYLDVFDKWIEGYKESYSDSVAPLKWPISVVESSAKYRKLRYIRYGGHFFLGVRGNFAEAHSIAGDIKWKLERMKLNPKLVNLSVASACQHRYTSDRAFFLGYEISRQEVPPELPSSLAEVYRLQTRPLLYIPTLRLRECFLENGFIKLSKLKTWIPFGVGHISPWPVEHIVRYFDRLSSGLLEYYVLADNYRQLSWFVYLLKRSCNLSIGRKLRLRSMRKVFGKYGRDLEVYDGEQVIASLPDRSLNVRPIVQDFFPELNPYLRRRQHIIRKSTRKMS